MANLILDVNINSASNLANVNFFTKMDVYAVVRLNGDNTQGRQELRTPVDRSGGSNPKWNHTGKFSVDERLVRDGRLNLHMKIRSSRRVLRNKTIGTVNVPVLELFNSVTPPTNSDGNQNGQEMRFVTHQVTSRSGKIKGSLMFSYWFNMPTIEPEVAPVSEIEPFSFPPPEAKIEYPLLEIQQDSDDWKHPLTIGSSSSDSLPISYGPGLTNQSFARSTSRKLCQTNHHSPPPLSQPSYECFSPPQISNGNGPYVHVPPSSSTTDEWTRQANGIEIELEIGLGAGLVGGLMMGDVISDLVNAFDI